MNEPKPDDYPMTQEEGDAIEQQIQGKLKLAQLEAENNELHRVIANETSMAAKYAGKTVKLTTENKTLKEKVSELNEEFKANLICVNNISTENAALKLKIEELEKYAQHKYKCTLRIESVDDGYVCDCGLREALKQLEQTPIPEADLDKEVSDELDTQERMI